MDDKWNSIKEKRKIAGNSRNWDSLKPELWAEIIFRIPPRFVPLFKFLCKNSNSAISYHNFAFDHFPHHNTTLCCKEEHGYQRFEDEYSNYVLDTLLEHVTRIIFIYQPTNQGVLYGGTLSNINRPCHGLTVSRTFSFPIFLNDSFKFEVVGNVNGLLLIHQFYSLFKKWNPSNRLMLWNPLTGRFFVIPKSSYSMITKWAKQVEVGFVYDQANDDYKIVVYVLKPKLHAKNRQFYHKMAKNHALVEIFSLRTKSWTTIEIEVDVKLCLGHKICFNGEIHWLVGDGAGDFSQIMSFNIGTEAFNSQDLPNKQGLNVLTVHEGSLSIITVNPMSYNTYWNHWNGIIEVWKFDREKAMWVCVIKHGYYHYNLYSILGRSYSRVQTATFMVSEDFKSYLFHLLDGTIITFIPCFNAFKFEYGLIYMDAFVESLLSPSYPFAKTQEVKKQ